MLGRILLVEDNAGDVILINKMLNTAPARYEMLHASSLNGALTALAYTPDIQAVLLDLNLDDSQGVDTIMRLADAVPAMPIIVLTGVEDVELAQQAVRKGAQDYLVKGDVSGGILDRAIRNSVERKRKDQVRKELAYESLSVLGTGGKDAALGEMLRPHAKSLMRFFQDMHAYMDQHSSPHFEAIRMLEERHAIDVVMRDMSNVFDISERKRSISNQAIRVAESIAPGGVGGVSLPPSSVEEAQQILHGILTRKNDVG